MGRLLNATNYSPIGDLVVVSVCVVMLILMLFSYVRRTRAFKIFLGIVGLVILSALADVTFNQLVNAGGAQLLGAVQATRCVYHGLLYLIFVLFNVYIAVVTRLPGKKQRQVTLVALGIFAAVLALDVLDTLRHVNVSADGGYTLEGGGVFSVGYVAFVAMALVLLAMVGKRLYRRVMLGFYGTMAMSFGILIVQQLFGQASFTVATFLFPVIGMFYIMHATPFDATIGALDARALEDMVKFNYERKRDFRFLSLYLRAFDEDGKQMPEALQATIRRFTTDFFKGALLFRVDKGHIVLAFEERRNPNCEDRLKQFLAAFNDAYRRYQYDYKMIVGRSIDEVSKKNEYVSFLRGIYREMPENTIHWIATQDIKDFNASEYILRELEDIYNKADLNDPRVLAYCQPVFNLQTGKYDTAEALMRLQLDRMGMVFPDQFIPLAEENGYIHVLTEIILNKTCRQIRRLVEEGYVVGRVSVNVSALELKDNSFCDDVTSIIERNSIPGEKIAIELTESMTDSDFMLMKDKISQLREKGIKFYLDDFGTGYSNLERIMALPFDIIKFDRSMVLACGANERSHRIVHSLANMLADLDYYVLFEGVENDSDETMCERMFASYLQGYKYSRPVPIERLNAYFEKAA